MQQIKDYYLKEGRLDLSTLDELEVCHTPAKDKITNNKQLSILQPKVYKDEQITSILKDMGNLLAIEN